MRYTPQEIFEAHEKIRKKFEGFCKSIGGEYWEWGGLPHPYNTKQEDYS